MSRRVCVCSCGGVRGFGLTTSSALVAWLLRYVLRTPRGIGGLS